MTQHGTRRTVPLRSLGATRRLVMPFIWVAAEGTPYWEQPQPAAFKIASVTYSPKEIAGAAARRVRV